MSDTSSRRGFLAAGLALPSAGLNLNQAPKPAAQASGGLRYRVLGRTGLKVTTVGFGSMITSDGSVIEKAVELGINYFDTARTYQNGNCERMVGAALKGKRDKVILSTKSHQETRQGALEHLDTSLKELGTDYIDIWYLHAKSKPSQITDERLEANEIAKKAGKVRFTGVSTHAGQKELIPAVVEKKCFDVILTSYNFSMEPEMDALVDSAAKAGIGVVGMKIMAGGFRRAKPGTPLHTILKREGAFPAALRWAVRNPNLHTTIPSITDMDQLEEDFQCMATPFTDEDKKALIAQLDHIRPLYCRMCGTCEGRCAQGLPVSDILRYLSYAEGYGEFQLGRENFLSLPSDLQQVKCSSCSSCTIRCPNGVRVAERVSRAQELFA